MNNDQNVIQNELVALLQKAVTCFQKGQLDEAEVLAQRVLDKSPDYVDATHLLGVIAGNRGEYDLADRLISQAIRNDPDHRPMLHFNLGLALYAGGRLKGALASFDQAIRLAPDFSEAYLRRGATLREMGNLEGALFAYDQVIRLQPGHAEAYNNRGIVLRKLCRPEAAMDSFRCALKLKPDLAETYNNYGETLRETGRAEEAEDQYRHALELKPDYAKCHSNLLFLLGACAELPSDEMLEEHRNWDRIHGEGGRLRPLPECKPESRPGQRLKVGYVSYDFCMHAASYFFEPLLAAHDQARFEIFCYSTRSQALSDATTVRLRVLAGHWRFVDDLDDAELARQIHADGIDILVDLAGHTRGNRLRAFTYRPAPVQVTYLGYFAGTGLASMDYWITDSVLHPPDTQEQAVELIWRLPRCWVCYQPPLGAPPVAPGPHTDGQVMFGSFSNLSKLTEDVIATWCELLHALPASQLLIMDMPLGEILTREQVYARFAHHGITPARLVLQQGVPLDAYLSMYARVDIVLDTFPRTGGTTTAEALWMGVPVVTLAGQRYVERISASKLNAVGLEDLVAESREEYLEKALALARDPARRADLRANLREQMACSPLCDGAGLARAMEESYESMWERFQSQQA